MFVFELLRTITFVIIGKVIVMNFRKTFMLVNFKSFYLSMLYKGCKTLKLCEGFFYTVKFVAEGNFVFWFGA